MIKTISHNVYPSTNKTLSWQPYLRLLFSEIELDVYEYESKNYTIEKNFPLQF